MRAGSAVVRWLGIFRLSARQLQQRWLESMLIALGIGLGVGVLTTGQSFVAFQTESVVEFAVRAIPEFRAVTVSPVRMDVAAQLFGPNAAAAVPVSLDFTQEPAEPTLEDLLNVRAEVPGVAYATADGGLRQASVVAVDDGPVPDQLRLWAEPVTPDEFPFRDLQFLAGGPFTWEDVLAGRPLIVLSETGAERLFPGAAPADVVGRTVTETDGEQGARWQIVGVVAREEGLVAELMAQSRGSDVVQGFVPVAARPWLAGDGGGAAPVDPSEETFRAIYFTPQDPQQMAQVVAAVDAYFQQKYGAGRVEARNPEAQREQMLSWVRPAAIALLALAGIGLLIAAVNILNLFTARVLRRQRVLATSVALGATRPMLFWQTAGEAMLLGAIGSGLGLVLASQLVRLLRMLLMSQMDGESLAETLYGGFRLGIDDALIGLATGVGLSLIFGLYPALLGARQNPVEALRVE